MDKYRMRLTNVLSNRILSIGIVIIIIFAAFYSQLRNLPVDPEVTRTAPGVVPSHLMREIEDKDPVIIQLPASKSDVKRAFQAEVDGKAVLVRDQQGAWSRLPVSPNSDGDSLSPSQRMAIIATSLNQIGSDVDTRPN